MLNNNFLSGRIQALDGLRGIAVIFVIIAHLWNRTDGAEYLLSTKHLGVTGVFIFFALSGFLISSLLLKEYNKYNNISLSDFWLRRVFRILPPFLVFISFIVIMGCLNYIQKEPYDSILCSVFFLKNFSFCGNSWMLGHFWSLSVEEQYYLIFPITLLLFCKRNLLNVLVMLFISTWLVSILMAYQGTWILPAIFKFSPYIIAGCIGALYYAKIKFIIERFPIGSGLLFYFCLTYLCFSPTTEIDQAAWFRYVLNPIASVLLVLIAASAKKINYLGFLTNKILLRIGVVSYSLYIWQQFFLSSPSLSILNTHIDPLTSILLAYLVAELSFRFIEVPGQKLGRYIISLHNKKIYK